MNHNHLFFFSYSLLKIIPLTAPSRDFIDKKEETKKTFFFCYFLKVLHFQKPTKETPQGFKASNLHLVPNHKFQLLPILQSHLLPSSVDLISHTSPFSSVLPINLQTPTSFDHFLLSSCLERFVQPITIRAGRGRNHDRKINQSMKFQNKNIGDGEKDHTNPSGMGSRPCL